MPVADLYSVTPAGSVPVQPGPVIANFCALVPVVRNWTRVQASSPSLVECAGVSLAASYSPDGRALQGKFHETGSGDIVRSLIDRRVRVTDAD